MGQIIETMWSCADDSVLGHAGLLVAVPQLASSVRRLLPRQPIRQLKLRSIPTRPSHQLSQHDFFHDLFFLFILDNDIEQLLIEQLFFK